MSFFPAILRPEKSVIKKKYKSPNEIFSRLDFFIVGASKKFPQECD